MITTTTWFLSLGQVDLNERSLVIASKMDYKEVVKKYKDLTKGLSRSVEDLLKRAIKKGAKWTFEIDEEQRMILDKFFSTISIAEGMKPGYVRELRGYQNTDNWTNNVDVVTAVNCHLTSTHVEIKTTHMGIEKKVNPTVSSDVDVLIWFDSIPHHIHDAYLLEMNCSHETFFFVNAPTNTLTKYRGKKTLTPKEFLTITDEYHIGSCSTNRIPTFDDDKKTVSFSAQWIIKRLYPLDSRYDNFESGDDVVYTFPHLDDYLTTKEVIMGGARKDFESKSQTCECGGLLIPNSLLKEYTIKYGNDIPSWFLPRICIHCATLFDRVMLDLHRSLIQERDTHKRHDAQTKRQIEIVVALADRARAILAKAKAYALQGHFMANFMGLRSGGAALLFSAHSIIKDVSSDLEGRTARGETYEVNNVKANLDFLDKLIEGFLALDDFKVKITHDNLTPVTLFLQCPKCGEGRVHMTNIQIEGEWEPFICVTCRSPILRYSIFTGEFSSRIRVKKCEGCGRVLSIDQKKCLECGAPYKLR